MVSAITERRVGRLSFAENSLGRLDPCPLLDIPEVAAVPGADRELEPSVHGHRCRRGTVSLTFDRTGLPATGEDGQAETAELTVYQQEGEADEQTCAHARTLATLSWPELP